jgi:hypothetical protein
MRGMYSIQRGVSGPNQTLSRLVRLESLTYEYVPVREGSRAAGQIRTQCATISLETAIHGPYNRLLVPQQSASNGEFSTIEADNPASHHGDEVQSLKGLAAIQY